ncbi:hypothetical protein CF98_29780 [Halopseudomonas bauzanensis]|nr:hypothetical protein CF98_29780 [Halopseudomonas bauzanensis]
MLEGSLVSELKDGRRFTLSAGIQPRFCGRHVLHRSDRAAMKDMTEPGRSAQGRAPAYASGEGW